MLPDEDFPHLICCARTASETPAWLIAQRPPTVPFVTSWAFRKLSTTAASHGARIKRYCLDYSSKKTARWFRWSDPGSMCRGRVNGRARTLIAERRQAYNANATDNAMTCELGWLLTQRR